MACSGWDREQLMPKEHVSSSILSSRQTVFQVPQRLLLGQQLLPLLLNLPLHLEFDLAQLVLLATQLLFLEAHALVGEHIARDGLIGIVGVHGTGELEEKEGMNGSALIVE